MKKHKNKDEVQSEQWPMSATEQDRHPDLLDVSRHQPDHHHLHHDPPHITGCLVTTYREHQTLDTQTTVGLIREST